MIDTPARKLTRSAVTCVRGASQPEWCRPNIGPAPTRRPRDILVLIEEVSEPPEQPLDTSKVHPVVPARRLDHRLIRRTAAPVLKISPSAAKDDELPLLLMPANHD